MKKKISIVIPVYNVENYLKECVDSLINQEQSNLTEIILIDDGSKDTSGLICDEYSNKYDNVIVIHQQNSGQSKARNNGIKKSSGEYIMFVDSDDYLDDEKIISKILRIIELNSPDLIMYGFKKMYENSDKVYEKKIISGNIDIKKLIEKNYYKGCPWDKIIKKKILIDNNIFFPEGMLSEDIDFCANILKNINLNKIEIINENPYVYRQRTNSTTKTIKESHINDIYDIIMKYYEKDAPKTNIINNFLAFEYAMTLGILNSNLKPKKMKKESIVKFYELKSILMYDYCKKVMFVNVVNKIIGIKNTSKLLGLFINLKEK